MSRKRKLSFQKWVEASANGWATKKKKREASCVEIGGTPYLSVRTNILQLFLNLSTFKFPYRYSEVPLRCSSPASAAHDCPAVVRLLLNIKISFSCLSNSVLDFKLCVGIYQNISWLSSFFLWWMCASPTGMEGFADEGGVCTPIVFLFFSFLDGGGVFKNAQMSLCIQKMGVPLASL